MQLWLLILKPAAGLYDLKLGSNMIKPLKTQQSPLLADSKNNETVTKIDEKLH